MSETLCDLLARRRAILNNRKAPIRLEIENPYIEADGKAKQDASGIDITNDRIYERRKAEILQYNNTSTVQGKLTRAQRYKQTVENIGRTSNQIVENADGSSTTFGVATCPDDLYLSTSSSSAGIPGPPFNIQYDRKVPLYGYAMNAQQLGIPNIGSLDAWDFNTGTNIQSPSGDWTTLVRIFHNIDNIDSEQVNKEYLFNMDIPIGLYVAGDISGEFETDISSNHAFINTIKFRILDHLGNDHEPESDLTNEQITDISLNYEIDSSNNFYAIKYLGNLSFSPTLRIEPLSYYEIQLKFGIEKQDSNEYVAESYVSSVYMNLTSNNVDTSMNITNVKLVKGVDVDYIPTHTDFTIIGTAQT